MSNMRWTMLLLICGLISVNSFAQETFTSKFVSGYLYTGISLYSSGKKSGTIALIFNSSRTTFPGSLANRDEFIESIAENASDLAGSFDVIWRFTGKLVNEEGDSVSKMLHIAVYPKQGISGIDKKKIKDPKIFLPATLKSLKEVMTKFGDPSEKELWSLAVGQAFGLNGIVYWLGDAGIAADAEGSITHILLRMEPKK